MEVVPVTVTKSMMSIAIWNIVTIAQLYVKDQRFERVDCAVLY